MGMVFGALRKTATSFHIILLVALSCLVLGAAMMIVFNELELLEPTPVEKMVYDWQRGAAPQTAE